MRPRRRPIEHVRPANRDSTRINDAIRVPNVRLIDDDGAQLGIKTTDEAREYAYGKNLDLVEVAAQADPPVAKVMDYGKYKYEQEQKAKQARKHQSQIHVKEIKLRPKIGVHDYNTKKGHVERFLNQRAKVKVTIMFRGRETTHPERGRDLLLRLPTMRSHNLEHKSSKQKRKFGRDVEIAPSDYRTLKKLLRVK